jgi:branched-chain amino acid transport system ATP-binding protein
MAIDALRRLLPHSIASSDLGLQVHDLHQYYGQVHGLKGISLAVGLDDAVAILGPNGTYKTTALRTIFGITKPRSGRILFRGRDLTGRSSTDVLRAGIAHVPQDRHIFSRLTVRDNLLLGTTMRGRVAARLLAGVVDLFPVLHTKMDSAGNALSGGEQQMVAIGRGLMSEPKLMLLDEPSVGLAPKVVESLAAAFPRIRKEFGASILLVEQNLELALSVASRAYVFKGGRIIHEGPMSTVGSRDLLRQLYLGG